MWSAKDDTVRDGPENMVYSANAGLVLLHPYLPILFERLGLSSEDDHGHSRIVGIDALSRAVHLLQYLVDGRTDAPAPQLALNRILCGARITQPVAPGIALDAEERATCDSLLCAVIAGWPILGKATSIAALRETFLQREGKLLRGDAGWDLHVARKNVDVLVDRIPWNVAMVRHRFMAEPIAVTW